MKKRGLLAVILVLGIVFLAKNNIAWADTADAGIADVVGNQGNASQFLASSQKGSVVPPPSALTVCSPYDVPGVYSIGGIATLHLNEAVPGYCFETVVWNHRFAAGRLPGEPPQFLSDVVFLRIYYHGELVDTVPAEDADIALCFALLPDKVGQIYFYDFYGPRFFGRKGPFDWVDNGSFSDTSALCTSPMSSGAYALVE